MSSSDESAAVSHAYRLEGLDCADCAVRLEKQMSRLPGVSQARVNFGAGLMVIEGSGIEHDAVQEAAARAGYTAVPEGAAAPEVARALARAGRAGAVESEKAGQSSRPRREARRSASFWLTKPKGRSAVFSLALTGLGLLAHWTGENPRVFVALFALAIVVGGYPIAKAAYYSLRAGVMDMDALTVLAAIGAGAIGQWEEGAAVVSLFALGNALESLSMERARGSVRSLLEAAPDEAVVLTPSGIEQRPTTDVRVGEVCLVRPGQRLPVDGLVTSGRSAVNEASITGESVPADKAPGSQVFAGTLNTFGALEVRATRAARDSTLSRIVSLVEQAQANKAPSERFVSRFARIYTPVVVGLATFLAVVPPLLFGDFTTWFYRALGLLIVACPCALVLSTPVTVVSALGNAARSGILIKGGAHLENLGRVKTIALDKTGTLTEGAPEVTDVEPVSGLERRQVLALAAAVERASEHPLARAVVARAEAEAAQLLEAEGFKALPGRGAEAWIDGTLYRIGSPEFIATALGKPELPELNENARRLEAAGKTLMVLASEDRVLGLLALADRLRAEAPDLVRRLRLSGVLRLVLLTGDTAPAGRAVTEATGVDEVRARLLPEEKAEAVVELRGDGLVAMVGDGVNDAPALAAADVGVAMGGAGSDTALEVADVVLMGDDLSRLPHAIRLGQSALQIIKQNVAIALAIKVIALLLIIPGWLNLWLAVFADSGASLIVIANGMRLLAVREPAG